MGTKIAKELKKAGLSKVEIGVYLYLLEQGLSTPPQIAKGTGILRANLYNTLLGLENKRLIAKQPKGSRFLYYATDPVSVIREIESRKQAVESVLPDLQALYKKEKNKPTIKFYYGMEQAKQVFGDISGEKKILFILATAKLFAE